VTFRRRPVGRGPKSRAKDLVNIAGNAEQPKAKLIIDVWADALCPWCYIGEHRLESAVRQFAHAHQVELRMHTFLLDPSLSDETKPTAEYLAEKYNVPVEQARAMDARAAEQAALDGLPYTTDRPVRSTWDMLRLVHLGNAYGYSVGWRYMRAMQQELFGGNPDAFAHDTLVRLGEELGIPGQEIRAVLASDRFADAVQQDHNIAVQMGARGVPFTVLARRFAIPGATSTEQYAQVLEHVWEQIQGGGETNG